MAIEEVLRWKLKGVSEVDKQRKGEKTEEKNGDDGDSLISEVPCISLVSPK